MTWDYIFNTFCWEHISYIILPQIGIQSEGCDWPAGAQESAVRLTHHPIPLAQGILGKKSQCGGVGKEQRQLVALCQ